MGREERSGCLEVDSSPEEFIKNNIKNYIIEALEDKLTEKMENFIDNYLSQELRTNAARIIKNKDELTDRELILTYTMMLEKIICRMLISKVIRSDKGIKF